jgi:DNA polymerase I
MRKETSTQKFLRLYGTTENIERALLLDVDYDGGQNLVYCKFYDLDDDQIKIWFDVSNYQSYCLVKALSSSEHRKLNNYYGYAGCEPIGKINPFTEEEDDFLKLYGITPYDIGGMNGIRNIVHGTLEDNIRLHHNYIFDNQLRVGTVYRIKDGQIRKSTNLVIPKEIEDYFKNESFEFLQFASHNVSLFLEEIPELNKLALDIEVETINNRLPNIDDANQKIISISLASDDGLKLVYLLRRDISYGGQEPPDHKQKFYANERFLLEDIFKFVWKYPILLTFNGDNFDLPYLYNRAIKLGIPEDEIPICPPKKSYGIFARVKCNLKLGIHLDLYNFFSNPAISMYAFQNKYERNSLGTISQALLGDTKIEHEEDIDELDYNKLAEYNLKDSVLLLDLMEFDNNITWNLIILICRITRLPISDAIRDRMFGWTKSIIVNEHRRTNHYIPHKEEIAKEKGTVGFSKAIIEGKEYQGAYVIEPKAGIYFNVVAMDFASLYPSAIKEYNLSYETINCGHPLCQTNKVKGTPYYSCKQRMGILAYIVGFFRDIRVKYFKPKSKDNDYYMTIQQALKVFINGSYGVVGSINFPFYCLPVAESTTAIGRHAILQSIKEAKAVGTEVLYGDTDSIFLDEATDEQANKLIEWSKSELGFDLEKEKTFQFLALSHRKKNYVGIHKGTLKVEMKGLMGKKKNTPQFIKNSIEKVNEVLKKITNMREFNHARGKIISILQRYRKAIGKPNTFKINDYAVNVKMSKNPDDYTKTTPQHVKAVRNSDQVFVKDDIISYVKIKGKIGAKLTSEANLREIDVKKYEELLKSTSEQIIDALGISWEEVKGQQTLF